MIAQFAIYSSELCVVFAPYLGVWLQSDTTELMEVSNKGDQCSLRVYVVRSLENQYPRLQVRGPVSQYIAQRLKGRDVLTGCYN